MSRTAAYLAALASTAVPGLDPVSIRAVRSDGATGYDVGFVVDAAGRRWTVRAPRTAADGARQEATVALLGSLAPRVPFDVPAPQGFVAVAEGRAMVYPYLNGWSLLLDCLPPGPGLAADLGRTIAALHDVDPAVFEHAGRPVFDAQSYREHRLDQLDRAAATGQVPVALMQRWERALDDETLWRFPPAPTHGRLTGRSVLAVFGSEDDASAGHVRALTGWEDARVADPADDLAAVLEGCHPQAADSVLESYAHASSSRPDAELRRRTVLAGELRRLESLLLAVAAGERDLVRTHARALLELQERTRDDDRLLRPTATAPGRAPAASAPAAGVTERFAPVSETGAAPGGPPAGASHAGLSPRGGSHEGGSHAPLTQEIPEHQLAKVREQLAAESPAHASGVNGASSGGGVASSHG